MSEDQEKAPLVWERATVSFTPKLKFIPSGLAVCSVPVKIQVPGAQKGDDPFYADVTVWRAQGEDAAALEKGTKIAMLGRWEDDYNYEKNGVAKTIHKFTAVAVFVAIEGQGVVCHPVTRRDVSEQGQVVEVDDGEPF